MKELSDVTCCVVDTGLFMQMAVRMVPDCKRVIYCNPEVRAFPSVKQGCMCDGFEGVEKVKEFWPHLADIDLFCFPDSHLAGLQEHLRSLGKAVWGSSYAQDFEQKRRYFLETLLKLGLDVPDYTEVVGVDELRKHLRDKEDQYIKISHWRGDMETTHWRNWNMDEGWLDWIAVNFGPKLKNLIHFLVFPAIKTDLEIGGDSYNVLGKWPSLMLHGIEGKDKSYFAAVTKRQEMPEQLQEVMEAFGPLLERAGCRNQISMEIRVKGKQAFYNDATQRGGMPSSASQHLLWRNFPLIVWAGANGECIDPEPDAKFAIEVMITSKGGGHDCWDVVEVPEPIMPWCRFSNCCNVDGLYVFPPDDLKGCDLGWLTAIGDTPRETHDRIKEYADQLPDGLNADVEALADVFKEIQTAEAEGIHVTDQEMPKPAEVLE